jgi:hypothetical protein
MKRKEFLKSSTLAIGSTVLLGSFTNRSESTLFTAEEIDEFVGAAHGSFEETKKIIEAKPLI